MRAVPKLIEDEIYVHESEIKTRVRQIIKDESYTVQPDEVYDLLLSLPDLVRILADILILEDFDAIDRYWAAYAFSYLIHKEDFIPDTTVLQIGYLDDLVVSILILKKIADAGDKRRFQNYMIRETPFDPFLTQAVKLAAVAVPRVIYDKIIQLISADTTGAV